MRTAAKAITQWLVNTKAIPAQMYEAFEYGIFSCLFSSLPILVVILLSIPFILLRKFAGGFHFSSPLPCSVTSVALLFACLFGIKIILVFHAYGLISSLVLLSFAFIIIHSPIDSKSRRLAKNEKRIAPLPELMDRKKRDIMERKGDKEDENKRQKQQKESSAAAL